MIDPATQYQRAADGFDRVAAVYDSLYGAQGENATVRFMKSENWEIVSAALGDCQRVLELGCGTGEDAVTLARAGKYVVATDISPAMAEAAAVRAQDAGLKDRLQVRVATAGRAEPLIEEFGAGSFDAVYSGFTLMYEPDLAAVGRGMAALLRPGGKFVVAVLSRGCLWETAWWFLHGHPIGAFRRWQRWTKTQIGAGQKILSNYYSPGQLSRYFAPAFTLKQATALLLIRPMPFLDPLYLKHRAFFDRLMPLERRIREWPVFNGLGYAFVAVFQKQ